MGTFFGFSTSSTECILNCFTKLKETKTIRKVIIEENLRGCILKIGNRKSNHFSRIYQQEDCLKFEYEMKGRFLRKYFKLLTTNNLEELESQLSEQFFNYFGKLLPLQYSYTDWLVLKLRSSRKQKYLLQI